MLLWSVDWDVDTADETPVYIPVEALVELEIGTPILTGELL